MRFFSFLKDLFNTYSYIKIFVPVFTIVLSIPLLKIYYWSYDASYLAAFGVGPEIYNRPIFSSKLSSVWITLYALIAFILTWLILCVVLFIFLYISYYRKNRIVNKPTLKQEIKEKSNFDIGKDSFDISAKKQ